MDNAEGFTGPSLPLRSKIPDVSDAHQLVEGALEMDKQALRGEEQDPPYGSLVRNRIRLVSLLEDDHIQGVVLHDVKSELLSTTDQIRAQRAQLTHNQHNPRVPDK